MTTQYNHLTTESKWREAWERLGLFQNTYFSDEEKSKVTAENKMYILPQLPYPSGSGLHVGHAEVYTACDIFSRYNRMKGKQVLQVIGWDAFGLPAENYAIKTNIHPRINTDKAIETFIEQIKRLGISVDWSRTVGSHNPDYYKFTQWFFLLMYERGLAYRKKQQVNWCDGCMTVLANEQVLNGKCERCGTEVIQKEMEQWFFKITEYADRLYDDLDKVDWPEESVKRQRDWIGRKKGINITYQIEGTNESVVCFTTRPDTNFGATFVVLAPEHDLVKKILNKEITEGITEEIYASVKDYVEKTGKKTELERISEGKVKTGVNTGLFAINNLNNSKMPLWISDFVLSNFGTGAVVGVPAHDKRDFEFAKTFNIDVIPVVKSHGLSKYRSYLMGAKNITEDDLSKIGASFIKINDSSYKVEILRDKLDEYRTLIKEKMGNGYWNEVVGDEIWFTFKSKSGEVEEMILDWTKNKDYIAQKCAEYSGDPLEKTMNLWSYLASNDWYTDLMIQEDDGIMINSDFITGMNIHDATVKIMDFIEEKGWGKKVTTFRLRDWSISRQRFWGAPIPMVYDPEGNLHPVDIKDLPVILPDDVDFKPTGQSPLTYSETFQKGVEEKYGKGWKREVDTLDTFMCSSWYYFRYLDPHNTEEFASEDNLKRWMPVDFYLGGPEHVNGHLLYARFFTKVLYDAGYIDFDEPFSKNRHQGLILGEDGRKMSKRWGNVINPTDVVDSFGADTCRTYEMFMGPLEDDKPWSTNGVKGVRRFYARIWNLVHDEAKSNAQQTSPEVLRELNKTIKKVGEDIEQLKFNTAIAKLMEFVNVWDKPEMKMTSIDSVRFVKMLAPFGPYLSEELYQLLTRNSEEIKNKDQSVHVQSWPEYDESQIQDAVVSIAISVNGKFKAVLNDVKFGSTQEEVVALAKDTLKGRVDIESAKKVIFVPDKIINFIL